MNLVRTLLTAGAVALTATAVCADNYPSQTVTIIAPFNAGGGVDVGARNLADGLSKLWNVPVVVENRPGAGSQIGTNDVATAKPDGHTILFNSAAFTTLPATRESLPYDPVEDFEMVAFAGEALVIVGVGPTVKAQTFGELVEEAKTRELLYATSGSGSSSHLLTEAIKLSTGMKMEPVHYKSGADALLDIAAGRVEVYVSVATSITPLLQDGKLRLLATMSKERTAAYPDVPTLAELGYKDVELSAWWGVFAPAGTPEDVVAKINEGVNTVLQDPAYQKFLETSSATFDPRTPAAFSEMVKRELSFWKTLVADVNIVQN